jgi:hypothetical protein
MFARKFPDMAPEPQRCAPANIAATRRDAALLALEFTPADLWEAYVGFHLGSIQPENTTHQQLFEESKLGARISGLSCQARPSHCLSCGVLRGA